MGIREGYTGYYPAAKGDLQTSEAGPGRPCQGLEWVGLEVGIPSVRGLLPDPPLRGPVGP